MHPFFCVLPIGVGAGIDPLHHSEHAELVLPLHDIRLRGLHVDRCTEEVALACIFVDRPMIIRDWPGIHVALVSEVVGQLLGVVVCDQVLREVCRLFSLVDWRLRLVRYPLNQLQLYAQVIPDGLHVVDQAVKANLASFASH